MSIFSANENLPCVQAFVMLLFINVVKKKNQNVVSVDVNENKVLTNTLRFTLQKLHCLQYHITEPLTII